MPLVVIRRPRPKAFSFSISRNCGVRCSESDLLLFVNGDSVFEGPQTLRAMVDHYLRWPIVMPGWFAAWRVSCGYTPVRPSAPARIDSRFRRVFVHAGGSLLLVERRVFQQLGGFNELLEDWGYEDTDLVARLEIAGFNRIEMQGVQDAIQANAEALRVQHFKVKDRELTWMRNRLISDLVIAECGVVHSASRVPGESKWVCIDGHFVAPAVLPQAAWVMERVVPGPVLEAVNRVTTELAPARASLPISRTGR